MPQLIQVNMIDEDFMLQWLNQKCLSTAYQSSKLILSSQTCKTDGPNSWPSLLKALKPMGMIIQKTLLILCLRSMFWPYLLVQIINGEGINFKFTAPNGIATCGGVWPNFTFLRYIIICSLQISHNSMYPCIER